MAYTYTVSRKVTNLTDNTWTTVATSSGGTKHIVITAGQVFQAGATYEEVEFRFDEAASATQWTMLVGGVEGAGNNVPKLVGDAGKHIQARLTNAGDVMVSLQYEELAPAGAKDFMHGIRNV